MEMTVSAARELMRKEMNARQEWKEMYGNSYCQKHDNVNERALALAMNQETQNQQDQFKKNFLQGNPVRSLLYNGTSHTGRGRCSYLETRKQENPCQRYGGQTTASQEVGWAMDTEKIPYKVPEFGIKGIIKKDFYTKTLQG